MSCDVLEPPVGEVGDRRVGAEALFEVGESLVVLGLGKVTITRCGRERTGLVGWFADLAIGFASRRNPHVSGLVKVRLSLSVGRLVDDAKRVRGGIDDPLSSWGLRHVNHAPSLLSSPI